MDTRSRYVLFGLLGLVLAGVGAWNYLATHNGGDDIPFARPDTQNERPRTVETDRVGVVIGGTRPQPVVRRDIPPVTDEHATPPATTVSTDSGTGTVAAAAVVAPNGIPLPTSYETQLEDTLTSISRKFYGTPNQWRLIAKANNIAKPENMPRNKVLIIPAPPTGAGTTSTQASTQPVATQQPTTTQAEQPVSAGGSYQHLVERDDNLWNIAKKYYGKGHLYKKIVEANPGLNPNKLPVGKKITIPDYTPTTNN